MVVAALGALACSDDPSPPPEPTPVPCPVETYICERASEFAEKLLVEQDFDWIVENYDGTNHIVCNDTSGLYRNVDPTLCLGAAMDEERIFYTVSGGTTPRSLTASEFAESLRDWVQSPHSATGDAYGPGEPRLYTLACTLFPTRPIICDYAFGAADEFMLLFSKIPALSNERSHLFFRLTPRSGGWTINAMIGPFDQARFLDPALKGGDILGFHGPPGQTKTFFPWPR